MGLNSVSNSIKEGSPKRLAELLDQQQEPFILEVYLNERGYNKRRSSGFEGISFGCLFGGKKLSKGSTRNVGLHGRRKKRSSTTDAARICNRIAKDLSNKLVCINEMLGMKGCDLKNVGLHKEATTMEESGRLSSGSFSTEFNSCSGSDIEDMAINGSQSQKQLNHQTDEDAADEMVQCSPISVLDEIEMIPNVTSNRQELEEPPSRLSFSFPNLKRATEECIFSASLWELFVHKRRHKRGIVVVGGASKNSCWRHMNSKKALQQTRQLLFDCVREAVESHGRPRKARHLIGPEELGKIICDKIRSWDKQSVNGKNKIIKLLRSDLLSSYEQQHHFDGFTEEVVKEVGDRILEEMTDEIVDLYLCKSHQISYDS